MQAVTWSLALSCGFVGAVASVQRQAAQAAPPASARKPASVEIELKVELRPL